MNIRTQHTRALRSLARKPYTTLVPGEIVKHSAYGYSKGMIVSVNGDWAVVLWSIAPGDEIPNINFQVKSTMISAANNKLRIGWSFSV